MLDIRKISALGAIATVGTLLLATNRPASAAYVAPDGAVSVNASYEAGTSSKWFIELQRDGNLLVQNGVAVENDAEIRQGLLELDWGFNQEQADGSFGTTGDPFHSTSLFMEAAARATLALQSYHPVSYTPDPVYYSSHIARYTALLHQTAMYMTTPSVAAAGQLINVPFTHRRYLLAAGLGEIGQLTKDPSLAAAALAYAQAGLALQLTNGVSSNAAVTFPNGQTKTVSLAGVNPELYGYDVNYQAVGMEMATFYYHTCSDQPTRAGIRNMLRAGLRWEYPWVALNGIVTYTGSTRVGVEVNRDGTLKQPDMTDISNAFQNGSTITSLQQAQTTAIRMQENSEIPSPDTFAADGADGSNIAYDQGASAAWNIANQKSGVTILQAGIQREDPALIQQACNVIDWGFAHQSADGSFGTTTSPYANIAIFVESTARASALLAAYTPSSCNSNPQAAYYAAEAQKWATEGYLSAKWLLNPTGVMGLRGITTSPQHLFALAAALQEHGALSGDSAMQTYAQNIAGLALALQQVGGVFPEAGVMSFNSQSISTDYAERIAASVGTSSPLYTPLMNSVSSSLTLLAPYVNANGDLVNAPGGSIVYTATAFGLGAELTGGYTDTLIATQAGWMTMNDTLNP